MRRVRRTWTAVTAVTLVVAALGPQPAEAQQAEALREEVEVSLLAAEERVRPGADVPIAVALDHAKGWHTNPNVVRVPSELGPQSFIATSIDVRPVPGATAHTEHIQWPETTTVEVEYTGSAVPLEVYAGEAVAFVPVTVAPDAPPGPLTLTFEVTYQACNERQCLLPVRGLPVTTTLTVVGEGEATSRASPPAIFDAFDAGVWPRVRAADGLSSRVALDVFGLGLELDASRGTGVALLLAAAALGGLLLNFTPCVLPVIPIKILTLSRVAQSDRRRLLLLGGAVGLGVISFWMGLGLAVSTITKEEER